LKKITIPENFIFIRY